MFVLVTAGAGAEPAQNPTSSAANESSIVLATTYLGAAKAGHHGRPQTMIVEGINDQGWIVGRWTDAAGRQHRFLMNLFLPAFSDISHHGAANVQVWTVSDTGEAGTQGSDLQAFKSNFCASGCKLAQAQATVE